MQLPPFEVLGGTHAGDLVTPGKRFFQYDYRLRLIAEDAFGDDVTIPPLEISYRIESKVTGGDTTQGRDQSYSLPRASMRLISLVPDDTSDIREAPAAPFTRDREPRFARQPAADRSAGILFGLAGVVALVMLISMLRRKTPKSTVDDRAPRRRARFSARSAKELDEVQRASRGGWTPELAGRALAALRIAGAYAIGRRRRPAAGQAGRDAAWTACWSCSPFGRGDVFVSGAATTETAASRIRRGTVRCVEDADRRSLRPHEKFDSIADEAVADRDARDQAAAVGAFAVEGMVGGVRRRIVVDLRKKVWS